MSSISVYSNANNSTRTINFDFVGDVLAASDSVYFSSNAACIDYYFKITAIASQDDGSSLPVKVVKSLGDLALNPRTATQRQSQSNVGTDYSDIKSMVIDYTYDFIHGHTANQYLSGCTLQRPMKFT